MILSVVVIYILLFGIESLAVQLEEPLYILTMQGFYNKINNNSYKIIILDTNEGNNNVEGGKVVTADASGIGNGGGRTMKGGVNMVQGAYSPIRIQL